MRNAWRVGFVVVCWSVCLATSRLEAAVAGLEFAGGTGTGSVDQFQGVAGGGWSVPWSIVNDTGLGSITATVSNASPLNGGGNYLSTTIDSTRGNVRRDYNSEATAPALNVANPHIIQFNHRLDAVGTSFATGGRRVVIFDNPGLVSGTSGSNTFALQVDHTGQWYAGNGNMAGSSTPVPIGIAHSLGTTYTVAVRTRPADRQFDVHISDGVNSALLTNLGYRSSAFAAGTSLHFAHDSNGSAEGINGVNSDTTFSLDALTLSNGTKNWVAASGDWFRTNNWASQGAPSIFDSVGVGNGGVVTLDNPTNRKAFAGSLALTNGTMQVATPLEVAQAFTLDPLGTLEFDTIDLSTSVALIQVGDLNLNGGTINIEGAGSHGLKLIEFSGVLTGSLSNILYNGPEFHYLALNALENAIELRMVVPEPSAFSLLAMGLLGMAVKARRRKPLAGAPSALGTA